MVPELRAMRLMEIAARVQDEYGGDLRASLVGPLTKLRQALKTISKYCRSGRRPHIAVWRHCTGSCCPLQLPACTCAHTTRPGTRELWRDIPRGAGSNRSGDPWDFRRSHTGLPVAETARPDSVQTQQSQMRSLSRHLFLCLFCRQTPWSFHFRMTAVRSETRPRRSGPPRTVWFRCVGCARK